MSDLRDSRRTVGFADGHARMTRRLRQLIGVDCQSMPTWHAAVRHGVSWSKARRAEKARLVEWDGTRPKRRPNHLGTDGIHRGKAQKFSTVVSELGNDSLTGHPGNRPPLLMFPVLSGLSSPAVSMTAVTYILRPTIRLRR
jgi:prepilin-type processing-associated H-X9-DG protein